MKSQLADVIAIAKTTEETIFLFRLNCILKTSYRTIIEIQRGILSSKPMLLFGVCRIKMKQIEYYI